MEILQKYRRKSETSHNHVMALYDDILVTRSACTTPVRSRCNTPEPPTSTLSDSRLHESLSVTDTHNMSLFPDNTICRQRSKLERMKLDVARLSHLFHRSYSSSQSSKEHLGAHMSSLSLNRRGSAGSRQITVEYNSNLNSSKHSVYSDPDEDWAGPDHNFSSSLVITSLENGYFAAEISLRQFPEDDLLVFVHNNELEIVVDKSNQFHEDKRHSLTIPYHCGTVDLPIFVDSNTLVFGKDSDRNVLILQGKTKGCFTRMRSASFDTSPAPPGFRCHPAGDKWNRLMRSVSVRRAKSHGTIVEELRYIDNRYLSTHDIPNSMI